MTMTDPIADMLTRLRNANQAYHDSAAMPSSKLKTHIAEILQQEGYIAGWTVNDVEKDGSTFKQLVIDLKYGPNRERSIAGVRRVSKPGLRVYAKSTSLPKVLGGLGRGDHLDLHRAADRQAGEQEGRGWGSPRLRLVRERAKMSRIGRLPIAVPGGVDVAIDGQTVNVKGPKGSLSHTVAAPITVERERGRHAAGAAARTTSGRAGPCTACRARSSPT